MTVCLPSPLAKADKLSELVEPRLKIDLRWGGGAPLDILVSMVINHESDFPKCRSCGRLQLDNERRAAAATPQFGRFGGRLVDSSHLTAPGGRPIMTMGTGLPVSPTLLYDHHIYLSGEVSELADGHDLGSCAAMREGSSPSFPTT